MFRTVEIVVALGPLAIYLVLLGIVNLRKRPLVVSGGREILLLGLALVGLAIVGPMQLFFPQRAVTQFGGLVWLLLISFYLLLVILWMLVARPRLVIYNISGTQLRAVLAELAHKLDPETRWAGDSLALPRLGVQLHLEAFEAMRNVTLVSAATEQNFANWRRLEGALRAQLAEIVVPPNMRGYTFVSLGVMLLGTMFYEAMQHPREVAQGFFQIFRL